MLRDLLRPQANINNPNVPLTSATLIDWLAGPRTHAGANVNEASSLSMPAVWRCVNLIAGTCASLPLHAYRTAEGDSSSTPVLTGQAATLLARPHPDLTQHELWETVFGHALLWGNAYLLMLRNQSGQVAELWPVHPSRVQTGRASDGSKVYVLDGNTENPKTDREILHFPGFGYDGICGLSPISMARQGIGLAMSAEEYGARLFGNGSLASGILQTDQRLEPGQADALKERWKSKANGIANAHEVVVLDAGAKFQQLTIPPEDAQFIESRRFQISEIARMFGVPPHLLMDQTKDTSWGSGIEQQAIGFVVWTLRPWLTRFEQRISRILVPQPVYAHYSVDGLLRGDVGARFTAYATARQWGWMSVNDIRKLEEMQPVDGGNTYLQPLNMTQLGMAPPPVAAPVPTTTEAPA